MEHIDSTGSRQDDQFDPAALGRVLPSSITDSLP